jgi:hypothetical protein
MMILLLSMSTQLSEVRGSMRYIPCLSNIDRLSAELEMNFSFPPAHDDSGNTQPFSGAHATGHILGWHRYTISLWEDALVNECGWQGGIPCACAISQFLLLKYSDLVPQIGTGTSILQTLEGLSSNHRSLILYPDSVETGKKLPQPVAQ